MIKKKTVRTSKIINRFKKYLEEITYPTKSEGWHIQGRIKNKSNQILKFDVRGMHTSRDGQKQKSGTTATKADKMVFETVDEWIIVDLEELHQYIKNNTLKIIPLEDIINSLNWNIFLPKYTS
jgi:hypothetical protein